MRDTDDEEDLEAVKALGLGIAATLLLGCSAKDDAADERCAEVTAEAQDIEAQAGGLAPIADAAGRPINATEMVKLDQQILLGKTLSKLILDYEECFEVADVRSAHEFLTAMDSIGR